MKTNPFLGATLLIAGTSIGAGMLALPVSTAEYGFFPSVVLFFMCWLCMMATGLLILEVNLWLKPGTNMISMATTTLGIPGKVVTWITYLLLFYSLMAAYVSAMGDLVSKTTGSYFHLQISTGIGSLLMIVVVSISVYLGMRSVDYMNRFFFFGKLVTYVLVVIVAAAFVHFSRLTVVNFHHAWLALPIIITSFGFQNTIPGLRVYLNSDIKKLRLAILLGSSLPLLIYILWQVVILGAVPLDGESGLMGTLASGQPATALANSLDHIVKNNWISVLFKAFTLCAIVTSFIGVSCSLFDFLIDSFGIKRNMLGKSFALLMTFLPPLLFAFYYPEGFIFALGYAGIFVTLLLGILPALMVLSGRYWKKIATGYQPPINRPLLLLIIVFCMVIICGLILQ